MVSGYLPAQRVVPRSQVAAALKEAACRASLENPNVAGLAQAWYERFLEEFPESGEPAGAGPSLLGSHLSGVYVDRAATPSTVPANPRGGGSLDPLPDRAELLVQGAVAARWGSHLAASLAPQLGTGDIQIAGWDLIGAWRGVAVAVGHQPVGYGFGGLSGAVLGGGVPIDRVEIQTVRPAMLPGWLGYIGPVTFHAFAARVTGAPHADGTVLHGTSLQARPHPRLTLGAQRAVMFGGDSADVDAGTVLRMLFFVANRSENNLYSFTYRWRVPTERWVPLTLYGEWAGDDTAGGLTEGPGGTIGGTVPSVPGIPQLALGFERSFFGRFPRREWYTHYAFPWIADGLSLGHPLGGNGTELLGYARADLLQARLRVGGHAALRERTPHNLYAPGRRGASRALGVQLAWRVLTRADLHAAWLYEDGEGWTDRDARAGFTFFF